MYEEKRCKNQGKNLSKNRNDQSWKDVEDDHVLTRMESNETWNKGRDDRKRNEAIWLTKIDASYILRPHDLGKGRDKFRIKRC